MEALIEDCERYAKIIEGIQVAPDNWKDGDPTRREPRETLLKCAAALRASAAPVEGMKPHFYVPDYQAMGDCRVCGHNDPNMLMPQHQSALPSDSGKAAPDAWRWRIKDADGNVSAWEISNSDPKISKMVLHDCEPLYAALAPATECGTVTHPSAEEKTPSPQSRRRCCDRNRTTRK